MTCVFCSEALCHKPWCSNNARAGNQIANDSPQSSCHSSMSNALGEVATSGHLLGRRNGRGAASSTQCVVITQASLPECTILPKRSTGRRPPKWMHVYDHTRVHAPLQTCISIFKGIACMTHGDIHIFPLSRSTDCQQAHCMSQAPCCRPVSVPWGLAGNTGIAGCTSRGSQQNISNNFK